ncbi:FadR/GntR family transcriptional regulator [Polymorphospora rubra]|uniref:FadR/GntR family transcriptional regulator n=1 Tax=Polymorphospora rubra TaxID=338584 RepID=UPI00340207C2
MRVRSPGAPDPDDRRCRLPEPESLNPRGLRERRRTAGIRRRDRFLCLDIEFHHRVLRASGNEMFVKLQGLVAEVLAGRHHHHLMPRQPHEQALQLHADVAQAIQRRDGDGARRAMVQLMEQVFDEMASMWEQEGAIERHPF